MRPFRTDEPEYNKSIAIDASTIGDVTVTVSVYADRREELAILDSIYRAAENAVVKVPWVGLWPALLLVDVGDLLGFFEVDRRDIGGVVLAGLGQKIVYISVLAAVPCLFGEGFHTLAYLRYVGRFGDEIGKPEIIVLAAIVGHTVSWSCSDPKGLFWQQQFFSH